MRTLSESAASRLRLLERSEVAVTIKYEQVVASAGSDPDAIELQVMLSDHREAAGDLNRHLQLLAANPGKEKSAGQRVALRTTHDRLLVGHQTRLADLKGAEERILRMYHDILMEEALSEGCVILIIGTLLPRSRAHIIKLEWLLREH